jgi:hypothetical protein
MSILSRALGAATGAPRSAMSSFDRFDLRLALAIFLLAAASFSWFLGGSGWNQDAHFDLTRSLVERRSWNIDPYASNSGDVARGPDGHFYINKPPGVSIVAAIPYAIVYGVDALTGISPDAAAPFNQWLVTALTCGLCGAAIGALLFLYGRRLGIERATAVSAALLVVFGTIIFPYSTMLMAHVPAALFLLIAFVVVRDRPLLAGVATGVALSCFYICAVAVPVLALLAFLHSRRASLRFLLGGLPFPLLLAIYQWRFFGSPFRTSLEASTQFTEKGLLFGVFRLPQLDALFGITLSPYRGLFFASPILLFALLGAVVMFRQRLHRQELVAIGAVTIAFFLIIASFNGWHGGSAFGPRYVLPVVPLLGVPLMFAMRGRSKFLRLLIVIAAVVSLLNNFIATATAPMPSAEIENPLAQYLYPAFFKGRIAESARVALALPTTHVPNVALDSGARNIGESLFGEGNRASVFPIALLMVGAWLSLLRRIRREESGEVRGAGFEASEPPIEEGSGAVSRREIIVVALITAVGGWFRLCRLGYPSLWLDELLNVDIIRHAKVGALDWLIGFERENGPLYFFFQMLGDRLASNTEAGARIFPALFGVVAIPLAHAVAARAKLRGAVRLAFTLLIALSPLHVYYSREGRGYSFLVLAALALSYAVADVRTRRSLAIATLAIVAAVYTAATAAPLVVALFVTGVIIALRDRELREAGTRLALLAVGAGLLLISLYARFPRAETFGVSMAKGGDRLFAIVANGFSITALENPAIDSIAIVAFVIALFGVVRASRQRPLQRILFFGAAALISSVAALALLGHWFSLRYAIFALPAFLLALAFGAVELGKVTASIVPVAGRWIAAIVTTLLVAMVCIRAIPSVLSDPFQKADWRGIAQRLAARTRPGDTIMTSNQWANASLLFYLQPERHGLMMRNVGESLEKARYVAGRRERLWLVAGGFHRDAAIRSWMGRTSQLLEFDPLEEVRVYYQPGLADFLSQRGTAEDRTLYDQVVAQAGGGRLDLASSSFLSGNGWHGVERDGGEQFRWCKEQCTMKIPLLNAPSQLRFRVGPLVYGNAKARMRLTLFGAAHDYLLVPGDQEIVVDLPARDASRAAADLLFQFPDAASPSSRSESTDTRLLGGSFRELVQTTKSDAQKFASVFRWNRPHAAEKRKGKVLPWNESETTALLVRCRSELAPRNATEQQVRTAIAEAALDVEFQDDAAFLDFVFQLLFGRSADPPAVATYGSRLRSGVPRERIIAWIMRGDEFRRRYLRDGK